MSLFNPEKLSVTVIPPADSFQPIEGRKYTLTHSDETGELFLDIGYRFNDEAIDPKMRDEVLAEWKIDRQCRMVLVGKAHVDFGEFSKEVSEKRLNLFKKEMNLALKGIIFGDLPFLFNHPVLLYAPIYIFYSSIYPQYRQICYYGTPRYFVNETHLRLPIPLL